MIAQNKTNTALEISERSRARAFIELLASKISGNIENQQAIKPPNIEQVKQIAKAQNATLVEYSIIDEPLKVQGKEKLRQSKLYIWIIKPTGDITFKQVDLKSLNTPLTDLVNKSRLSIGAGGRGGINVKPTGELIQKQNLQKLYQVLIEPIASLLPTNLDEHVIFIPHDSLFLVPFVALQDKDGKYLIEKHTILTAPAIQVLDLTRQQRQNVTGKDVLVMGNPTMPKVGIPPVQLPPLEGAGREAVTIASLFKTKAITGKDATKAAFKQKLLSARIIHLATHGLLDDADKSIPSAIAFAPTSNDDGLLTPAEIVDLKINAELVVLSACDTGRGKITGDGVVGLSRSLITAGASSVIVYAADASFDDFYAGAFTYLLTQYLWQQGGYEPVNRAIVNVARNTKVLAGVKGNYQDPDLETNFSKENTNAPIYFSRFSALPAEAVVTQVNKDQVKLWLGGIDSQSLEAFKKDMILTVLDPNGGERGLVKLGDRQGLIADSKLLTTARAQIPIEPGTLLQERIRSIPSNLTLKIGIDQSFDSNTAQQATQALQALNRIEPKPVGTVEVQYIFGRMTDAKHQQLQKQRVANLPTVGSFGLFLPSQDQIVPASFGNSKETLSEAVKRLQPKLKSLLAARIVKQMLGNTNTSQIAVTASMNIAGNNELLGETFTIRGGAVNKTTGQTNKPAPVQAINSSDSGVAKLPIGTAITFQVQNNESSPLYVSILLIDAQGEMTVIFPNDWSASEDAALVQAKQKQVIPQADDAFKLTIGEPLGISEALIIASTTPLRTSLKVLQKIAQSRGLENRRAPVAVPDEVLDVTNSLLDDLDAGTRGGINVEGIALPDGVRGIDTKKLAAMAIAFEVVPATSS